MLGWNIWVDDLGGTINKSVILIVWLGALAATRIVTRGSVTSLTPPD
jgi:hypothetical protein